MHFICSRAGKWRILLGKYGGSFASPAGVSGQDPCRSRPHCSVLADPLSRRAERVSVTLRLSVAPFTSLNGRLGNHN